MLQAIGLRLEVIFSGSMLSVDCRNILSSKLTRKLKRDVIGCVCWVFLLCARRSSVTRRIRWQRIPRASGTLQTNQPWWVSWKIASTVLMFACWRNFVNTWTCAVWNRIVADCEGYGKFGFSQLYVEVATSRWICAIFLSMHTVAAVSLEK